MESKGDGKVTEIFWGAKRLKKLEIFQTGDSAEFFVVEKRDKEDS